MHKYANIEDIFYQFGPKVSERAKTHQSFLSNKYSKLYRNQRLWLVKIQQHQEIGYHHISKTHTKQTKSEPKH